MHGASTTDGKLHGNRQLVEAYDKDHGKKSKHLNQRPEERGGESGGSHNQGQHDEIKSVVGEHGPAHSHTVTKQPGGGYMSSTEHEDGYTHDKEHETVGEAHEHGANAMDDTDHLEGNQDTHDRGERRHSIEKKRGGSDAGMHFME